jgi:hypothetical protein
MLSPVTTEKLKKQVNLAIKRVMPTPVFFSLAHRKWPGAYR